MSPTASSTINPQDMSLKQFVRQRRFFLIAALSWVAMLMLTFSVIIPQFQEISYVRDRLDTEQRTLTQLNNKLQFLTSFDQEGFQEQNGRLNIILPSTKPFLPLLHSLKQLAADQGVIFSGLEWSVGLVASDSAEPVAEQAPGATARQRAGTQVAGAEEGLSKMDLELKVLGTTDRLNSYFDVITKMAPVVEIETVSLSPKFQVQEGIYEAAIKLSAFYAPLLSLRGAVVGDRPLPRLTTEETEYVNTLAEYRVYLESASLATPSAAPATPRQNPFSF